MRSLSASFADQTLATEDEEVQPRRDRVLILGSADSGKSTLMKQLRLLYGTEDEIRYMRGTYRIAIYLDMLDLIKRCLQLLEAREAEQAKQQQEKEAALTSESEQAARRRMQLAPVLALEARLEKELSKRHASIGATKGNLERAVRKQDEGVEGHIFAAMSRDLGRLFRDAFTAFQPNSRHQ
jgi:guanine nucleotide-binding protein subunit alpha